MSSGRTLRTPFKRPQAAINEAAERAVALDSSPLGQWRRTGKLFVALDTTGTNPFIFKGGSTNPLAYFVNTERVDEQRFRQVFLLEHKRLKIAYTPVRAYVDQAGKSHPEVIGDPGRIKLIDEVARALRITERKMDDFETVERGLLERIQYATFVGDDILVVKLLKALNHFRKNKTLMKKSEARDTNLIDSVKDKRFGNTGYAYQGLIDESALRSMLERNGVLQAPVLDAIISAANANASVLANIAVQVRNGEIGELEVDSALQKAAQGGIDQAPRNVYDAVVGRSAPRAYIEPVTINAAVDGAGRVISGKRIEFSGNPQEIRYGETQNGRVEDEIDEEVAEKPRTRTRRFLEGTVPSYVSSSSSGQAVFDADKYAAEWKKSNPQGKEQEDADYEALVVEAVKAKSSEIAKQR